MLSGQVRSATHLDDLGAAKPPGAVALDRQREDGVEGGGLGQIHQLLDTVLGREQPDAIHRREPDPQLVEELAQPSLVLPEIAQGAHAVDDEQPCAALPDGAEEQIARFLAALLHRRVGIDEEDPLAEQLAAEEPEYRQLLDQLVVRL